MAYIPLINYRYDEGNRRIQTGPNHEGYVVLASGASAYGVDNGVIVAGTPLSGAVTSGTLSSGLWSKDANWRFVGRPLTSGESLDPRPYVPSGEILGTRNAFRILGRNKVAGAQVATAVGPTYPINPAPSQPRTLINPDTSSRYYAGKAPDNQNYTPFNTPEGNTAAQGKTGGGITHRSHEGGILTNVLGSQGTSDRSQWRYNEPVYCQTFTEAVRSQSPSLMGNVLRYVYRGSSSTYNVNYGGYLTGGNAAGVSPGVPPAGAGGYYPAGAPYEPVPYVSGDTSPPPPAPTGVVFTYPLNYWYKYVTSADNILAHLPRMTSTISGDNLQVPMYQLRDMGGGSGGIVFGVGKTLNAIGGSGDRVWSTMFIPDPPSGAAQTPGMDYISRTSLVDYSPEKDYVDLWISRIHPPSGALAGGPGGFKNFPVNWGRISIYKEDGQVKEVKNWVLYSELNYNAGTQTNLGAAIYGGMAELGTRVYIDEDAYNNGTGPEEVYMSQCFIKLANRFSLPYGNPNSAPLVAITKFDRDLNILWAKCPVRNGARFVTNCGETNLLDVRNWTTSPDNIKIGGIKHGVLWGSNTLSRGTDYFELDPSTGETITAFTQMEIDGNNMNVLQLEIDENYIFMVANNDSGDEEQKNLFRFDRDGTQNVSASLHLGASLGTSTNIFSRGLRAVDGKLISVWVPSPTFSTLYIFVIDIETFTIEQAWRTSGVLGSSQGTMIGKLPQKGWFYINSTEGEKLRFDVNDMPSGLYPGSAVGFNPSGGYSFTPQAFVNESVVASGIPIKVCSGATPTNFVDYQSIPVGTNFQASGFLDISPDTDTSWIASGVGTIAYNQFFPRTLDKIFEFNNGYGL